MNLFDPPCTHDSTHGQPKWAALLSMAADSISNVVTIFGSQVASVEYAHFNPRREDP
jgi:hypothetical protein